MKRFILLILAALLLSSCSEEREYPCATVVNASGAEVTDLVIFVEEGDSYGVASLLPDEEREFSFSVKGESTIALECRLNGEPLSHGGAYVEENYNYHVIFTIEPSGTVTVELDSSLY
ncbi:lipoprotein [bacterium]|nr:lipoprotein [bacterium]